MISFEQFRLDDSSPIYSQLIRYLKRGLAAGEIENGDELPSRRVLSALLGVNPATVQKTYRLLEEEGLLTSHGGAKSVIVASVAQVQAVRGQLQAQRLAEAVTDLRALGISRQEALALFTQLWDQEEKI